MTKDEALKLALEALEYRGGSTWLKRGIAVEAIKEALAHPVTSELLGNPKQLAQPEQREWVGLTRREVEWCFDDANGSDVVAAKNIEAKLKEKNT